MGNGARAHAARPGRALIERATQLRGDPPNPPDVLTDTIVQWTRFVTGSPMALQVNYERMSNEAQRHANDRDHYGSARHSRWHARLRADLRQVLAGIAERDQVLRLQRLRGLGGGLRGPHRPR